MKKQQNIKFSDSGTSYQNGASKRVINTLVTMESTMLMHDALRCPEEKFSTDIWPMSMYYAVWVYNRIPDMQSGLSDIEMWSRSRFETV